MSCLFAIVLLAVLPLVDCSTLWCAGCNHLRIVIYTAVSTLHYVLEPVALVEAASEVGFVPANAAYP
jgi:hypothetical protein